MGTPLFAAGHGRQAVQPVALAACGLLLHFLVGQVAAVRDLFLTLGLVSVATLFTYQHHVLDVLAGAVLGGTCVVLVQPQRQAPWVALYYALGRAWWGCWAWPGGRGGSRSTAQPACLAPVLWVGRRLSQAQLNFLPPGRTVVDLTNELSETPALRNTRYHQVPLLDLVARSTADVQRVLAITHDALQSGHPVYLHCAMGYSRSRNMASAYLAQHPQAGRPC